ncbi:MAG TPA: hypothetical protein VI451_11990 [Anaerolineales bacterium]|nr:hypothetical protein [Anaerolineales bacterium]
MTPFFLLLFIFVVFLSACAPGQVASPSPTGTTSPVPTMTPSNTPVPSATSTATPSPTLRAGPRPSPTITPTRQPSPTPFPTPTLSTASKIRLLVSIFDSQAVGHKLYLHVFVWGGGWVPKSIQIIERSTGLEVGEYELFETTESVCHYDETLHETEAIDLDDPKFPPGFYWLLYEEKYLFQIVVEDSLGTQVIVKRASPDLECLEEIYPLMLLSKN